MSKSVITEGQIVQDEVTGDWLRVTSVGTPWWGEELGPDWTLQPVLRVPTFELLRLSTGARESWPLEAAVARLLPVTD
jgi:hypothetical protein